MSKVEVDCSDDELTEFVEGMLSLRQDFGLTKDDLVKPTDAGIVGLIQAAQSVCVLILHKLIITDTTSLQGGV